MNEQGHTQQAKEKDTSNKPSNESDETQKGKGKAIPNTNALSEKNKIRQGNINSRPGKQGQKRPEVVKRPLQLQPAQQAQTKRKELTT